MAAPWPAPDPKGAMMGPAATTTARAKAAPVAAKAAMAATAATAATAKVVTVTEPSLPRESNTL